MKRARIKINSKSNKTVKAHEGEIGDVTSYDENGQSTVVFKNGDEVTVKSSLLEEAKRGGRKKGSGKTPILRCIITGSERNTSLEYLNDKAERLGVDVDTVVNNYINKSAMVLLRKGEALTDIRRKLNATIDTPISDADLTYAMSLNGKQAKAKTEEAAVEEAAEATA